MSAAVLVDVHLCKGLWPEELWWIQELSGDNHMALRLQLVQEVTENLTSKNPHLSPLAFWAMNRHLQDQFVLRPWLSGSASTTSTCEQPRAAPKEVSDKVPSDLDGNRSWHKMLQVIAWSYYDSTLSKSILRLNFILQIKSRIQFLCLAGNVSALQDTTRRGRNNSNMPYNQLHLF